MTDDRTIRFYDQAAARFAGQVPDRPGPELARFIAALPAGAEVLDLGCGHGIATAQMVAVGLRATGHDVSTGLLEVARRLAPGATFERAGFDDLTATEAWDGIWSNYALLHAPRADMGCHLSAIARALRPGVVFHLSMLLGEGELRDAHGRAYTFHSDADLRALVAAAGLEVVRADTVETMGVDGSPAPALVLLARKGAA